MVLFVKFIIKLIFVNVSSCFGYEIIFIYYTYTFQRKACRLFRKRAGSSDIDRLFLKKNDLLYVV